MILRWFISKTVRHAGAMRKHVWKLLQAQKDILSTQAVDAINGALKELDTALAAGAGRGELQQQMDNLEKAANKWLKPYPHPVWRENLEVALVALAIAISIRTFFIQPFKIPTASMQPTLYGVMPQPGSGNQTDLKIPGRVERFFDYWIHGFSYVNEVAPEDGALEAWSAPVKVLLFNLKQNYLFNGKSHTIWFPADNLFERARYRAGGGGRIERYNPVTREMETPSFHRDDDILRLKVIAGDHLLVDRVSYNFCHPQRGDIIVFDTHDIQGTTPDTYYIKRLVGLGGETLKLQHDYDAMGVNGNQTAPVGHLVANGQEINSSTPGFASLYDLAKLPRGAQSVRYRENDYYEHAMIGALHPDGEFQVRPNHFFVMGDNTMNSSDSRYWGDFQQEKVMGKSFFVYWPISKRFGMGYK